MRNFKSLRINTKFIIWFLIISITPLFIAIYISYNSSRNALLQEVKNSLAAVADNRANQIESYLLKKKTDTAVIAELPEVMDAMQKFFLAFNSGLDSPEYKAVEQEYRPMITYYKRTFDYDNIIFMNLDGYTAFSVEQNTGNNKSLYEILMNKESELASTFTKAKESQEIEVSGFEQFRGTKKATAFIVNPVFKEGKLLGMLITQVSNLGLNPFVHDYSGLGETGEAIIVEKEAKSAVFITPVRFDPLAAYTQRVNFGSRTMLGEQNAVRGKNGSGVSVDYSGKETLAAWRYLPTLHLGLVIKMDTREVFALADRLKSTLFGVSLALIFIVLIMAILIARSVSTPITELKKVSKVISSGNLSARAKITSGDEIGELAQSFNQMTDSLVEAKNIVEQERAEVEEQKRLLEEANKELDSFVYTVSHDLRAPLRGIDGFAILVEQEYADKLDEQGKDFLARIRNGAKRMQNLIDDLLTLSRISRIKNPFEDVQMNEIINSVLSRLEFDIKKNNVELMIRPELPVVHCDRIKIEEVFFNLINNAIKYSSKNKDTAPKVEIGYNNRPQEHEFFVKDNGIGIDEKYHKKIFGIFTRLHRQDEYEGTGAGLSIVKKIIDDHKGVIWLNSKLGEGAQFYFTIPKA